MRIDANNVYAFFLATVNCQRLIMCIDANNVYAFS